MAVTVGEINARLLRQRFQLLRTILGQQQPVDKQLQFQFIEIYFSLTNVLILMCCKSYKSENIFNINLFFPCQCANVYVQQIR
jgi:hypothetical protein